MKKLRIALCQIMPGSRVDRNVEHALDMVDKAASRGADIVALPEIFYTAYDPAAIRKIGGMERIRPLLSCAARRNRIYLCPGSIAVHGKGKLTNTSYLMGPDGRTLLTYGKCHLFDVKLGGTRITESDTFAPGGRIALARTAAATIGILICYDIRFPEMARRIALSGAELLIVPAVFNRITGPAHWNIMIRARAIENQIFVAAVSQASPDTNGHAAYGHSLIVSPWGTVLAEAGEGEEIIFADLDPAVLEETRKRLPLLKHRREDLY